MSFLNDIFSSFDNLVHEFGLEKIKTIGSSLPALPTIFIYNIYSTGDAYMFVGGLSKTPLIQTKHGAFTPAEAVAGTIPLNSILTHSPHSCFTRNGPLYAGRR